jgi:hypothetical protein
VSSSQASADRAVVRLAGPLSVRTGPKSWAPLQSLTQAHKRTVQVYAAHSPLVDSTSPPYIWVRATTKCNNGSHGSPVAASAARKVGKSAGVVAAVVATGGCTIDWIKYKSVRITRIRRTAGLLDAHDNLGTALKGFSDGVALVLGLSDNDPRIEWAPPMQVKGRRGEYWVGLRIEFVEVETARNGRGAP